MLEDISDEGFITPSPPPMDDQAGFDPLREINHLESTGEGKHTVGLLIDFLRGFRETTTTLRDGRRVEILAKPLGEESLDSFPWGVTVSGTTLQVTPGLLMGFSGTPADKLTLDPETTSFPVALGSIIAIEISGDDPTTYKIDHFSSWPFTTDIPAEAETRSPATGYFFKRFLYPLYEVVTASPGLTGIPITGGLLAERLVGRNNLRLVRGLVDTEDGAVYGPAIIPF